MVDSKDILLKTAEMIEPDNWCAMAFFSFSPHSAELLPEDLFSSHTHLPIEVALESALASKRCLEASLATATALLGGTFEDYNQSIVALDRYLVRDHSCAGVISHNDTCVLGRALEIDSPEAREAAVLELKDDVRRAAEVL